MCRRCCKCAQRLPNPPFITIICILIMSYLLYKTCVSFLAGGLMHVFEKTGSASEQSLEIVICPMPRIHPGRLMHKGQYIPAFLNYLFFFNYLNPLFKSKKSKWLELTYNMTTCQIDDKRAFRPAQSLPKLISEFFIQNGGCWPKSKNNMSADILYAEFTYFIIAMLSTFHKKMNELLFKHFEVLDERLVEDYDKLFENAWVLKYENITLSEWLDFIDIDFMHHMNEETMHDSLRDLTAPLQEVEQSTLSTRIAPSCLHEVLTHRRASGYQPSKIVFPFYDNCSLSEEVSERPWPVLMWPRGSLCLETKNMYASVYITTQNSFTDIPMAGAVIPYRVPFDHQTRINVGFRQNLHAEKCRDHGSNSSQVTCMEDCLFRKVLKNIDCMVPWLQRLVDRPVFEVGKYSNVAKMRECNSSKDLNHTMDVIQQVFDRKYTVSCQKKCPRDCSQITITTQFTGSIRSEENPHLELVFENSMNIFSDERIYSWIQLVVELMDTVSFFIGISFIGVYDWLIGVLLWSAGRLPYIPAMRPLWKKETYANPCCCAKYQARPRLVVDSDSEDSESDDSDVYLAKVFKRKPKRKHSKIIPTFERKKRKRKGKRKANNKSAREEDNHIVALLRELADAAMPSGDDSSSSSLISLESLKRRLSVLQAEIKGKGKKAMQKVARQVEEKFQDKQKKRKKRKKTPKKPATQSSSSSSLASLDSLKRRFTSFQADMVEKGKNKIVDIQEEMEDKLQSKPRKKKKGTPGPGNSTLTPSRSASNRRSHPAKEEESPERSKMFFLPTIMRNKRKRGSSIHDDMGHVKRGLTPNLGAQDGEGTFIKPKRSRYKRRPISRVGTKDNDSDDDD